jgi:hypothetical protein
VPALLGADRRDNGEPDFTRVGLRRASDPRHPADRRDNGELNFTCVGLRRASDPRHPAAVDCGKRR